MGKKYRICTFIFMCFLLCFVALLFESCCSPKEIVISVHFQNADSRLGLKDYKFKNEFGTAAYITFDVPKGYDHTKIKGTAEGYDLEYSVDYEIPNAEETYGLDYLYDLNKTVTYKVAMVKRSCRVNIDMTEMTKKTFNISLDTGMSGFKVLIISKDQTEGLVKLLSKDVKETIEFNNNVATVEYGKIAILLHNRKTSNQSYSAIYSELGRFTAIKNIQNQGTLRYSEYPVAQKGNTLYNFNYDSNQCLYYLGEIRESIDVQPTIPNFQYEKGFSIDRTPNIFYLFTNLTAYNSDILTMNAYSPVGNNYNGNDLDSIDGVSIQKVSPAQIYNDRYEIHKIYLGHDMNSDPVLTDRENVNTDLYLEVSSCLGISNINFYLLAYEREDKQYATKLEVSTKTSTKGRYFIKLSSDVLQKYCQDRDQISGDSVYPYKTGSAILYPNLDDFYSKERDQDKYSLIKIWLTKNIIGGTETIKDEDIFYNLYTLDNSNKKHYGLIDYNSEPNSTKPRDFIYLLRDDIFPNGKYCKQLYADVRVERYVNYRSVTINSVSLVLGKGDLLVNETTVKDCKICNGIDNLSIDFLPKDMLWQYEITANVKLKLKYSQLTTLDFSYLEFPSNEIGSSVYMTSKSEFSDFNDFFSVTPANKTLYKDNGNLKFSSAQDLYYFVKCDEEDFDIEMRLDPNDPSTCISKSNELKDITGERRKIYVHDVPYYIRVVKQDTIYSLLTDYIYVVKK